MNSNLPSHKKLSYRLTAYAASAGAFMALGLSSQAQVVHSGEQNLTLSFPDDTLSIDLDGDMVNDFAFQMLTYNSSYSYGSFFRNSIAGWALILNSKTDSYKNSWITELATIYSSGYSTSFNAYQLPIVAGLEFGNMVDPMEPSWGNASYPQVYGVLGGSNFYSNKNAYGTYSSSLQLGNFTNEEKFIGVRFYIGDKQHYGWIRISLAEEIEPLTIIDWAYEQTPGKFIQAGQGLGLDLPPAFIFSRVGTPTNPTSTVTLTATETITGFTIDDIVATNGIVSNFTEVTPGEVYSMDIEALEDGQILLEIEQGVFTDLNATENNAITFNWIYDITGPIPIFENYAPYSNYQYYSVYLSFDEPVSELTADDFIVTNGIVNNIDYWSQGMQYYIEIFTSFEGQITVELPAGVTQDEAGNPNSAGSVSWIFDETPPEVNISGVSGNVSEATQTLTLTFSEEVQYFSPDFLDIFNGSLTSFVAIIPGVEYQVDVTANDLGIISFLLPEFTIYDLAGNPVMENTLISWNYVDISSVENQLTGEISISPNPSHDQLTIKLPEAGNVRIMDLQGKTILHREQVFHETIDISSLNSGVYIIQVEIEGITTIHKFAVG
jgi:hypothetical protein